MRILEKKEVYEIEGNKETTQSYANFVQECRDSGAISEKKYTETMNEFNRVYRFRHNLSGIDDNFTEIFSTQGKGKIASFANQMGAEMAGIEHEGFTVLCTNVEWGINFSIANPKKENFEDYVTLVDLIAKGLENPKVFKAIVSSDNTVEPTLSKSKLKM